MEKQAALLHLAEAEAMIRAAQKLLNESWRECPEMRYARLTDIISNAGHVASKLRAFRMDHRFQTQATGGTT